MPLRSVEAATRDDAIAAAREQFGPSARVVGVRRVRSGGVLGFFATERYVAEVAPDAGRPAVPAPASSRSDDAHDDLDDLPPADFSSPLASAAPARARSTAPARNGAAAWAAEARSSVTSSQVPSSPAAARAEDDRVSELAGLLAGPSTQPEPVGYGRAGFPRPAATSIPADHEPSVSPVFPAASRSSAPFSAGSSFAGSLSSGSFSSASSGPSTPAPFTAGSVPAEPAPAGPSPFTAALARMVAGDRDVRQAVAEALDQPRATRFSPSTPRPSRPAAVESADTAVPSPATHREEETVAEHTMAEHLVAPPAPEPTAPEIPEWAAEPEASAPAVSSREEAIAEILRAALAQGHSDEALAGILRKVLAGASPQSALSEPDLPADDVVGAAPVAVAQPAAEPVLEPVAEPIATFRPEVEPVAPVTAAPIWPAVAAPATAPTGTSFTPRATPSYWSTPAPLPAPATSMWGSTVSQAKLWGDPVVPVVKADAPIWAEVVLRDPTPAPAQAAEPEAELPQAEVTVDGEPIDDADEPVAEVTEPAVELTEQAEQAVEPTELTVDVQPIDDTDEPVTEVTEPIAEAVEPVADVAEVSEPIAEAVEPVADVATVADVVEATEPAIDAAEPVAEATEPAIDAAEPVADVADVAEVTEPAVEPVDDADEPVAEVTEPAARTAEEQAALAAAEEVVEEFLTEVELDDIAPVLARTASDPAPMMSLDSTTVMPPLSLLPPLPGSRGRGRPPVPAAVSRSAIPSRTPTRGPVAPEAAATSPAVSPSMPAGTGRADDEDRGPAELPGSRFLASVTRLPVAAQEGTPENPEQAAVQQPLTASAGQAEAPEPGDVRGRLEALGLPRHLLGPSFAEDVDRHGAYAALTQALATGLPKAPSVPTGPGEALFVVGPGVEALRAARTLAASLRLDPDRVQWATRGDLAGLAPRGSRMTTVDTAIERRQDAVAAGTVTIVAVDAPLRTDAWWMTQMLGIWTPVAVWAVVEATRKPEDLEPWLDALPQVDALVVQDTESSADPAAVLRRVAAPVAMVDGVRATPHRWASLLCERLENPQT